MKIRSVKAALASWGALALAWSAAPAPAPPGPFRYDDLEAVLVRHVAGDGRVDYPALVADRTPLDRFVDQIARVSPVSHPALFPARNDRLAYWINAYNALMLRKVVDAWPVRSVKEIRPLFGVFRTESPVGGRPLSLKALEDEILRKEFDEPRIHFAVNCASISCPPLKRGVWHPATLDAELDQAARAFVGDDRNVRLDRSKGLVLVSSIFDWYEEDFLRSMDAKRIPHPRGVLDYIARYLPAEKVRTWPKDHRKTATLDYDWGINARAR